MRKLNIDIETYCDTDIKTAGSHKYAEKAEIMLFGYSYDYGPVEVIDMTWEDLPSQLFKDLTDPNVTKYAFNAAFERACIGKYFGMYLPPEQWECTMVRSAMAGYPLSLDESSKALGLTEKKDAVGKALIRYFCMPCKSTKANNFRTRNFPSDSPEKWEQFIEYCRQDVVTEQAISKALAWYKIPEIEKELWCLDQRKNERGVKVDIDLINAAIQIDDVFREKLTAEAVKITGLSNVNSPAQLKKWLADETDGKEIKTLNKLAVADMLKKVENGNAKRILEIRALMAKSSIKKYLAMKNAAGIGDRVRGMIQYYGAQKSGRESGRLCQPQNFPRISDDFAELVDYVRVIVKNGEVDLLNILFSNLSEVLSQLLRTCFMAEPENELAVLDYKAVEAVILSYIADETWRLKIFEKNGDIYKASAAAMFKIKPEEVSKDLRQKGKISELLCQYGGTAPAMEKMNETIQDVSKRIPKSEMKPLIKAWRTANPNIVQLWWDTGKAAVETVKYGVTTPLVKGISFSMNGKHLLMNLPSGRSIVYANAHIQEYWIATIRVKVPGEFEVDAAGKKIQVYELKKGKVGEVKDGTLAEFRRLTAAMGLVQADGVEPSKRESLCYWGSNQTTKKWEVIETYGPKLVQNFVEGWGRDLLMYSCLNMEKAGAQVILTVHDELMVEFLKGKFTYEQLEAIMIKKPKWAGSMPLNADGFIANYYKK